MSRAVYSVPVRQRISLGRHLIGDTLRRWTWGLPPRRFTVSPQRIDEIVHSAEVELYAVLRDMRSHILPNHSVRDALRIDAPASVAQDVHLVPLEPSPNSPMFGFDLNLADFLGDICMLLLSEDVVPVLLVRNRVNAGSSGQSEEGVEQVLILRPRGVEDLERKGFRIHPIAYHEARRSRSLTHSELVPREDVVLYHRPISLGVVPPLLAAIPAVLERGRLIEEMPARAAALQAERPGLRQQLLRVVPMNLEQRDTIIQAQEIVAVGGSILDQTLYNPQLADSFTDYYLAWQHRRSLFRAADLRNAVLETTNDELLPRISMRWEVSGTDIRVSAPGAPQREGVDHLFQEFVNGALSLAGYWQQSSRWLPHGQPQG